jgi:octaprenyl-diphosphate synthase
MTLVSDDLSAIKRHIENQIESDVPLIREIGRYIVDAGGKRLRPITLLLAARSLGYQGTAHIDLGAVIEFIHTATLLHDDVVDKSDLRRGRKTTNAVWGNPASVLVGDFLYSRAFEMMVAVDRMGIMRIMAATTNRISEGEVLQLLNTHSPIVSETDYLDTITRKTAKLFESAAQIGALLANAAPATESALAKFGLNIGISFQIIDDALDYRPGTDNIGKNTGDDLADGKMTLPLIHALRVCTPSDNRLIQAAISTGDRSQFDTIVAIIESTDSLAYTSRLARTYAAQAQQALELLPPSDYRNALSKLAEFAVSRTY